MLAGIIGTIQAGRRSNWCLEWAGRCAMASWILPCRKTLFREIKVKRNPQCARLPASIRRLQRALRGLRSVCGLCRATVTTYPKCVCSFHNQDGVMMAEMKALVCRECGKEYPTKAIHVCGNVLGPRSRSPPITLKPKQIISGARRLRRDRGACGGMLTCLPLEGTNYLGPHAGNDAAGPGEELAGFHPPSTIGTSRATRSVNPPC